MWSAFMNGSGLHGGGGYVPSQGWEFVPCSRRNRADRGRGKSHSPLRRISSPPTVFSQHYEPLFGVSPGAGEGGSVSPLEVLRGQMWPGPEPQQEQQRQQTQHTRLKKKFEDLKKRHLQDKEGWTREKESLLREMAEIQGGENRRILLDLKTVLEEVQLEVKREEEKRSELQLEYTRDRCAWELEKAELKCRISQLEAREGAGSISGGVQSAQRAQEQHSETPTLHREREEQRRLLEDTRTTAMDLRCRLELNERDWSREKAELLERFDMERREWESQLRDMQKKIEELYSEVRAKREGTRLDGRIQNNDVENGLSIPSISTGSSLHSDNSRADPTGNSSQSEPVRFSSLPGFVQSRNISGLVDTIRHHSPCFLGDSLCEQSNAGSQFTLTEHPQHRVMDGSSSRGTWQQHSVTDNKEALDATEHGAIFQESAGHSTPQTTAANDSEENVILRESPLWSESSYGSEKNRNMTALNAALKEIARVSKELCSYQDEIRRKSGDKRNSSESLCLHDTQLQVDEPPYNLNEIYSDFQELDSDEWIVLSPDNMRQSNRGWNKSQRADPDRETPTSPEISFEFDTEAPPIPPRTSSWNLSATTQPDTELHIPESPLPTMRKCHSPCNLLDNKGSSPSIVRKFGAMLQENEGKVLIDDVVSSCSAPANSKCNIGCCHNRWSCDASKFSYSKLSTCGSVQKSFSEVNILTAQRGLYSNYSPGAGELKDLQMPPIGKDLPLDLLLSSVQISPTSLKMQGSKRNIMLEQKTAEFNRTLFQAEMGRGVEEQDRFAATDVCPLDCQTDISVSSPSEEDLAPIVQPQCTSVMAVNPKVTLSPSISDPTVHEIEPTHKRCGPESQEINVNLSSEQSQTGLVEESSISSQSITHNAEVQHVVKTASSPFVEMQQRAATEALFSEPVLSVNIQPGQNVDTSSSKNGSLSEARPQAARDSVSFQQPSVDNKQRQTTQTRHVSVPPSLSDSARPGPRMLNEHPWKPLTLAAYPRPEGSRSNYGAVERILRNYESAARAQQNQSQQTEVSSCPNIGVRKEESLTDLDTLDTDPLPLPVTLRHTQTHAKLSSYSSMCVKEMHGAEQEKQGSSVSSSSIQKNFTRPV